MQNTMSFSLRSPLNGLRFSGASAGYLSALVAAVVMSLTGIIIKHISDEYALPPAQLAFWRNALVFLTLLPVLTLLRVPVRVHGKADNRLLVAYGFMLASMNLDWTIAVIETGASVATVLSYCSAAYSGILGWLLLGERMSRSLALAVVICLSGCALVCGVLTPEVWSGMSTLGLVTGFASGLLYAGYGMMGRLAACRGLNPWVTLLHIFGYASLFQVLFNVIAALFVPSWGLGVMSIQGMNMEPGCWVAMLALAVGPTLLGMGMYNVSLGMLSVGVANTILLLEPALAATFAYFTIGEMLTPMQWAGIAMITGGVAVLPRSSSPARLTEEHAAAVADAVGAVGAAVQAVPGVVGNAVQSLPEVLPDAITGAVTAAVNAVPGAVDAVVQAVAAPQGQTAAAGMTAATQAAACTGTDRPVSPAMGGAAVHSA
ncbi:DMT family transporter [Oleidesulfovibrio alaskensis]|uniref:DMT family transporter n=2 Tax=Oleidesulfovibrio alaskensis TaxID=58180 RepID=UPI00041EB39F|nr:EamA family transporter [Oleidesulfovibrio alaskensis]